MPNPYAFISLFSFFIVLAVGGAVYLTGSRKTIHTSFLILCLFNAYVAFPEFMMRQANDPQTALFWLKAQSFWRIVVIVVLHFSLIYIGKDAVLRRWWGRIAFYGPVTAISFMYLVPGYFYYEVVKMPWGYSPAHFIPSLFGIFLRGGLAVMGFLPIALLIYHYFQVQGLKEKKQTQFVILGLMLPHFFALFSQSILPILLKVHPPELLTVGITLKAIIIGYAIKRYDLFALNPAVAAEKIIAAMADMQVLLNSKGKIVSANQAAIDTLGYTEQELILMPVADLLPGKDVDHFLTTSHTDHFGAQKDGPSRENLDYYNGMLVTKSGRQFSASVAVSSLWERDGELAGYVVVARDMTIWKKAEQEKTDLIAKLQDALANLKTLKALIPICSACGLVRNDDGYWQKVEEYLSEQADVDFSHSICEKCAEKLYPEFYRSK